MNNETMIEETGTVVSLEGAYAVIETQQRSACGHCNVGDSCGTSVLAGFFSRRRNTVKVLNHLGLTRGEQAVIGIDGSVLLGTAVLAYMLPLLLLIGFAVVSSLFGQTDDINFVAGMIGLFAGMQLSNRIMGDKDYQSKQIVLLRKANEHHINLRGQTT